MTKNPKNTNRAFLALNVSFFVWAVVFLGIFSNYLFYGIFLLKVKEPSFFDGFFGIQPTLLNRILLRQIKLDLPWSMNNQAISRNMEFVHIILGFQ